MPGERGSLLKPPSARPSVAGAPEGELLRWSCSEDRAGSAVGKEYTVKFPWDTLACIAAGIAMGFILDSMLQALVWNRADEATTKSLLFLASVLFAVFEIFAVLLSPTRVCREADRFVVDFPLHRGTIPIMDVQELVMVTGFGEYLECLTKWGVAPFGSRMTIFCGTPSGQSAACALLTNRCFFSYYFCLEDPIGFLVDQQKLLDLTKRYRTLGQAVVRKGESLKTEKICMMRRGARLRIEKQSGRRVYAHFEEGNISGWMSYINMLGHFLLAKDGDQVGGAPGTVGASQFTGSYGVAMELASLPQREEEEE